MKKVQKVVKEFYAEIFLAILWLLAYAPVMIWMWNRWFARDSYYSHGILVPFVSGYLIWQKRRRLGKLVVRNCVGGIWLIVAGVLLYLASSVLRIYFSSAVSMLIVLVGLVWYLFGLAVLKEVSFPLGFLFFMVPLPLVIIVNISFKMKLFAAEIAERILNHMGMMAVRTGSIIRMRNAFVIVDDVCSGLRSLISLAALGSIFAYWLKAAMIKRLFLFLMTVPIAIVTNVCRVVLLSTVSEVWGAKYAIGFLHDLSGFLVFGLAFILLYVVSQVIE